MFRSNSSKVKYSTRDCGDLRC